MCAIALVKSKFFPWLWITSVRKGKIPPLGVGNARGHAPRRLALALHGRPRAQDNPGGDARAALDTNPFRYRNLMPDV